MEINIYGLCYKFFECKKDLQPLMKVVDIV